MMDLKLAIEGMHCQGCVESVCSALRGVPGVEDCDVEVGSARVRFDEQSARPADLIQAVRACGAFNVTGFSKA